MLPSIQMTKCYANLLSIRVLSPFLCQAAEDAKLLRSVVVPLEEEIDLLKMKLNQAEERLSIYEGKVCYSLSLSL